MGEIWRAKLILRVCVLERVRNRASYDVIVYSWSIGLNKVSRGYTVQLTYN